MLQKLQRPLSERERLCLSRPLDKVPSLVTLSGTLRWFSLWLGILALCVFLGLKGISQPHDSSNLWSFVIPAASLVGILSFYFAYAIVRSHIDFSRQARQFGNEDAPKIRAALEDGQASVWSVTSERAVVIEEFEDEGSAYIFSLGDGHALYLWGHDYIPEDDNAPWPARHFEIVRTRLGDRLVGIFTGTEPVPQVRTVPIGEMSERFLHSDETESETILPGEPDEILKRLGHQGS